MKHLLAAILLAGLAACASTDPLTATYRSCEATRAAVEATDAAVLAGQISKSAAQKALAGFVVAQAGCDAAVQSLKGTK